MADRDYELEQVMDVYRRDGSMIREKSRVLVEEWLDRLYPRMVDQDIPTSALLEIGKVLIDLGDLKPKKDIGPVQQGPGFSITINIPQPDGNPPITIEGTAIERSEDGYTSPVTSDGDDMDEEDDAIAALPERTTHFTAPGFDLDDDLVGVMQSEDE